MKDRYWQNTWQYKRIIEILEEYWVTEKDESFVKVEMHLVKGDEDQHKTIIWRNPNSIPDDAEIDLATLAGL